MRAPGCKKLAVSTCCLISLPLFALLQQPAVGREVYPVESTLGMVVAGHPEAAGIGAGILNRGGNAMDAVVATGFALGVAEPYGSGVGGKCAILYFEAATGKTWYIDGLDASGSAIDISALVSASSEERAEGVLGIGVPGMVAAMHLGHQKWGKLPWRDLLEPAIKLARDGFTVVPGQKVFFERRLERIQSNPECTRIYLPGGSLPEEGSRLSNPDLARTLEHIARDGKSGFYQGEIASRIIAALKAGGSHLSLEDFASYEARIRDPLTVSFNDNEIIAGGRPTSGGAMVLLSLKLLEEVDFPDTASLWSVVNMDLWGRVFRHLYPVIQANIADTHDYTVRWESISNDFSISRLRSAAFSQSHGAGKPVTNGQRKAAGDGWTTHFVVADRFGNLASVTQSLSHHFGSGVVPPGTGIVLNNSLTNFSFSDPEGVNFAGPDKRPRSTISPVIVLRDNRPVLALGLPGGGRIPTTTSAILLEYLEFGCGLGQTIQASRFHLLRDQSADPDSNVFQLEAGFNKNSMQALSNYGWGVESVTDSEYFGGVTAIEIKPDGRLVGWADFRRTNHAIGGGEN